MVNHCTAKVFEDGACYFDGLASSGYLPGIQAGWIYLSDRGFTSCVQGKFSRVGDEEMVDFALDWTVDQCLDALVEAVRSSGCSIATAESLTGGQLAAALSSAAAASDWYKGGIVAYQSDVKHGLLSTPAGPVVTAETASAMAVSVAHLLGARFSLGVTGVGGPDPQDGVSPGTVFVATFEDGKTAEVTRHNFSGQPLEILQQTVCASLRQITRRIKSVEP